MFQRISARRGQPVNLNMLLLDGGSPADPFAIRKVEIYKEQVLAHNLIAEIPILDPDQTAYPSPITRLGVGNFELHYDVPSDLAVPLAYIDVWYFYPTNPCEGTDTCDLDAYPEKLISNCSRFWVYPDSWWTDDKLQSVTVGFEPLTQQFNHGDVRNLEVGMMPLPLYDFDYNLIMPMLPFLTATIKIRTRHCELLVDDEAMTVGLRQGTFRTNPFVLRWPLDTNDFMIGTYEYRIKVTFPNGVVQASPWYVLQIN